MNGSLHSQAATFRPRIAFRNASARCFRAARTPVRIISQGEPDGFKRNAAQQMLKDADDSVRDAQKGFGDALNSFIAPLGKAVGMGGRKSAQKDAASGGPGTSRRWTDIQPYLASTGLKSVTASEVDKLMRQGYVFVSVIPSEDFKKFHPKGCINVPLYEYIGSVTSPMQALRKAAFAAQAVKPIETNPQFEGQLRDALKGSKGVIFACNSGGTIRGTDNFPQGQSSRSLISASLAICDPELEGLDVLHLQGGLNAWFKNGFEGEGTDEAWEDTSGRVPTVRGFSVEQDAEEMM